MNTALELIARLNIVLSSGTVLIAFSLLTYLFLHNFGNRAARAFVIVLALVTVVYIGDVFLVTARLPAAHPAAGFWLRFEWLGIAFVAPAYLYFGHRLLAGTGDASPPRLVGVALGTAVGAASLWAVSATDLMVRGPFGAAGAVHFDAGPWFPPFAAVFAVTTLWGVRSVWLARQRTLTIRSRRRMSLLLVSVIAPLSVFPYLVMGGGALAASPLGFRLMVAAANTAAAAMLVVVAYAVAFQGALTPERHVRRELVKYLVQVPTLGFFVILATQVVPERFEGRLGLPRDVILALTLVVGVVLFRVLTDTMKPLADRVIYGRSSGEAMWLRRLDQRLLTHQDLEQLLENILATLCDLLRVPTGFVVVMRGGRLQLEAFAGNRQQAMTFIADLSPDDVAHLTEGATFTAVDGFRVHALHPPGGGATLGFLAVADPQRELSPSEEAESSQLVSAAERALEDRVIQGRVLGAMRELEPELEGIQRLRGALEPGGSGSIGAIESSPIYAPDFPSWVKDALTDYWGGPRLTESPLLRLKIVSAALEANEYNPAKAMRDVLDAALERMRPEGERSMTAYEWLAYNILELKFVRGLRVRDIAGRLALSESDLYRKQRVAIEALAHQLKAMEAEPGAMDEFPTA